MRRRHLTWWRKDLCEPTINALESITGTLDIVTPELQCYADTCQKAIAAEATAFAELKSAHSAYKTAIGDYKDRAKTYNTAAANKKALKESTLSALEGFKSLKQTEGPIFQRDLAAFNRYDDGSDQGRCGLTSCQLHSVCKHQIKDHFADFVNKDTCKAVPVSADTICQSESCQRFVTVTRTNGDSWGMDLKFKCGDKTLSVGPSDRRTKTIRVDNLVDGSCPSIVNQKNWLGGETHGDTFTITNGACVRPAEIANGVYSLKGGREGKFCASEGNKIVCDRDSVGGWEKYTIEKHGDWYALKAHNGKYCADERYKIVCDRDSVGGWERFNVEKIGEEFALRSDRDHKYCADTPGGVNCLKVIPHHSEMFTIERIADSPPPSPPPPPPSPPPSPPPPTRTAPARETSLSSASTPTMAGACTSNSTATARPFTSATATTRPRPSRSTTSGQHRVSARTSSTSTTGTAGTITATVSKSRARGAYELSDPKVPSYELSNDHGLVILYLQTERLVFHHERVRKYTSIVDVVRSRRS